jgi:hypothetical protein
MVINKNTTSDDGYIYVFVEMGKGDGTYAYE